PARKAARARMERAVYRQRGVFIATDYLVNSGGVIFAAQEQLIKTPEHLRVPDTMLADRKAGDYGLGQPAQSFGTLARPRPQPPPAPAPRADPRRTPAGVIREPLRRHNMCELIDLLVSDADMLPCEAAEPIRVRRSAARERGRTAADLMEPIPTITLKASIHEAAAALVEAGRAILAVVTLQGELAGVVTRWDITRAIAQGLPDDQPLEQIMTRAV